MSSLPISRFKNAAAVLFFITAVLFASFANAQTDPARTLVDTYIAAQHGMQWRTVAACIAPGEIGDFKRLFKSIFAAVPGPIDTTILRPASFGKQTATEIVNADSVSYFCGVFTTVFDLYPVMKEMATTASNTVLGSVNEGDDMKHFVCRVNVKAQQENVSNIEVVTLRKVNGKWYVAAKRSMEQMAALLKKSFR